MKLTLCSNAGLSIDTGESRILVDIVDDVIDNPDFFSILTPFALPTAMRITFLRL